MKNILVTGVSRGLGLTISKELLENGFKVYGVSRSLTPELKTALRDYESSFEWLSFDLTQVTVIKAKIFKEWIGKNPIHGFVNNAAISIEELVTNLDIKQANLVIRINQLAPMIITKHIIRNMILHNTKGSIVHIGSVSAHTGYKGLALYASTKAAIEAFSKTTAREWGPRGIRSNSIAAGFMETDMTSSMSDAQKYKTAQRTSLKAFTNPISIAKMTAFLLDESSESITGQVIHIDAGTI